MLFALAGAAMLSAQGNAPFVAGAGALLRVTVADRSDLSNVYRVDPAGMIVLPQLGEISVQGLSLREVAAPIGA